MVSVRKSAGGIPLVIHKCCRGAEEDALLNWPIVGHFRY
jgi:uncharacterized protein YijF (DUF1287 family)